MATNPPPDVRTTVLITGCSKGGIGEALAFEFKAKGMRVLATARRLSAMEALQAAGIETFELDVTKSNDIIAARDHVQQLTGGKLDILVNNAGRSYPFTVADASLDEAREIFEVNFFGPFAMTQAFLPLLMASSDARILQIGSVAAVMPVPFGGVYNASKAALHSLSDTLRVELAPFNIKVMTAALGNVGTNITTSGQRGDIPKNSLYYPINDIYRDRRIDHFQEGASRPEEVARGIVAQVTRKSPPAWWWGAKNSWLAWFIHTFLPRTGFDRLLSVRFGISQLAARILQGRKNL